MTGQVYGVECQKIESKASSSFPVGVDSTRSLRSS